MSPLTPTRGTQGVTAAQGFTDAGSAGASLTPKGAISWQYPQPTPQPLPPSP